LLTGCGFLPTGRSMHEDGSEWMHMLIII